MKNLSLESNNLGQKSMDLYKKKIERLETTLQKHGETAYMHDGNHKSLGEILNILAEIGIVERDDKDV